MSSINLSQVTYDNPYNIPTGTITSASTHTATFAASTQIYFQQTVNVDQQSIILDLAGVPSDYRGDINLYGNYGAVGNNGIKLRYEIAGGFNVFRDPGYVAMGTGSYGVRYVRFTFYGGSQNQVTYEQSLSSTGGWTTPTTAALDSNFGTVAANVYLNITTGNTAEGGVVIGIVSPALNLVPNLVRKKSIVYYYRNRDNM